MKLDLVAIAPPDFDVDVTLAYATDANLTGRPVYRNAECWLHREAAEKLGRGDHACPAARAQAAHLRCACVRWRRSGRCGTPGPTPNSSPTRAAVRRIRAAWRSISRLLDGDGRELDMGTAFDAFTPLSHHGRTDVSAEAQRNRLLLMGLMTAAGWDFYRNEWWHYQLFDARRYPLISDADLPRPMM